VAPKDVVSICFFKGRIWAAQKDTNRVWYTQAADLENPTAALIWEGYLDVRLTGEAVLGLQPVGSELFVFKRNSTEAYYYDDALETIRPIDGSAQMVGLESPRGYRLVDNNLFFVTQNKAVVVIAARQVQPISTQVDSFLRTLSVTDDANVFQADRFLLFQFKAAEQTLVFDLDTKGWYRWSSFIDGKHKQFKMQCSAYQPGRPNNWLFGAADNNTYFMDFNVFKDADEPIALTLRTAHLDHGTSYKKQSTRLLVRIAQDSPRYAASVFGAGRGAGGGDAPLPLELGDPPPATRCSAYSYTYPERLGYAFVAVGLPSYLTFTPSTRVLSGTVACSVTPIQFKMYLVSPRGARYVFDQTLLVEDLELTLEIEI